MATMYSLFLGFLLTAACSVNGNGDSFLITFLCRSVAAAGPVPFLLTEKEPKGQGLAAPPKFKPWILKIKNSPDVSGSNSLIFLTVPLFKFLTASQPRPFFKARAIRTSLQSGLMSPVKILTIALGGTNVRSECSSDKAWTLGRYQVSRLSGMEDKRKLIITIASAELGTKEVTGNNDGARVEQYLRYTNLGPGYDWCAAFISWVYGQAGLSQPRNPWSPALFPKAKSYKNTDRIQQADLFGIYSSRLKRIHHVGLIKEKQGQYILTIEGNSNDRVESRRRHQRTVYSYADWMD
ncbi:CHAP domain-containing protein [Sphingobacterium tabacisoli]|uniref:CHAP domain-containing protein n=1 Tax=Sphingobacterium tabacisoli TaxID=2044855 RepID=A0ABW5L3Y2_9SPHI|nr:CHAP domain-containing protein [Sphingobacterium tabacisoli]